MTQTDSIFGILFLGLLWYFIWTSWGREQKFIKYFSEHQNFDAELETVFRKIETDINDRQLSWECMQKLTDEINDVKEEIHGLQTQNHELKTEMDRLKDKLSTDLYRLEENLNRDLRESRDEFRDLLNMMTKKRYDYRE
ncbi:MAG: hypothetical protein UMV23_03580, partial [Halanaerobium sp.]|nr:hypothetical protein [Halanaerobium sp.]